MNKTRQARRRNSLSRKSAAINGAYDFVAQSYDLAARRLESIERRINHSLVFFTTATFAIGGALLALAPESAEIEFANPFFGFTILLFVIAVVLGIASNLDEDRLAFINPQNLYEANEAHTTLEFRAKTIETSGQDFATNRSTITRKRNILIFMNLAFISELLMGYAWVRTIFESVH